MLLGAAPLGDLAVGDGPPAPFFPPPGPPNQAFDVIVAVSPASGAYVTTQTNQSFHISRAPRPTAAELFTNGAIFAFQPAISVAGFSSYTAIMQFTGPGGVGIFGISPNVYVGGRFLPTVIGVLQKGAYLVYVIGRNVLIPGLWKVAVTFFPYPGASPLTDSGSFHVPQMAVEFV